MLTGIVNLVVCPERFQENFIGELESGGRLKIFS
jgi:hypothetical protein